MKPLFPASPTFKFRFEPLEYRPILVPELIDHTCSDIKGFLDIAGCDALGTTHACLVQLLPVPDQHAAAVFFVLEEGSPQRLLEPGIVELDGQVWRLAILALLAPGCAELCAAGEDPLIRSAFGLLGHRDHLGFHIDCHGPDSSGPFTVFLAEGADCCHGYSPLLALA